MERFGTCALLRSLAVGTSFQRRGFGHNLVARLERDAQAYGVEQLVLLTETAEKFFRAIGYEVIDRRLVPEEIKQTAEFRSLCPASAVCMTKLLARLHARGCPMADRVYNVLFLCTGNSARSILAEAILSRRGKGRFNAFSAGSHPKGAVHPLALALLERKGLPTEDLRSKAWDEFAQPGAPNLDFIFTVCDNAAGEVCPIWPGQPMTAHWGQPDPAAVEGSDLDKTNAFREAFRMLERRIDMFTSLPIASLDQLSLEHRVREIGNSE
jgi:arsenate reductase